MENYIIRLEREEECRETENLVREAFWNVYRPGCLEHFVLHEIRKQNDFLSELNFVMEKAGTLIGQIVFVRAEIQTKEGGHVPILTAGPICIAPTYQGQGYGKALVDYAMERAAEMGFGCVCFEGDIRFYGKSGFTFASQKGLRYHGLPEGADDSFFLCKELKEGFLEGIEGEYATPSVYFVDEAAAEAFDASFPQKEKKRLDGQIF